MKKKTTNIRPSVEEIAHLKELILAAYKASEKHEGKNYFDKIANCLKNKAKDFPSPSTLQRLWSYKADNNSQSFHIENLNLCVKVFGYNTWQEFSDSVANKDEEVFDPYSIDAKKMTKGSRMTIGWKKHRQYCDVEYLGNYEWRILEKEGWWPNMHKETFTARYFSLRVVLVMNKEGELGYINRFAIVPHMKKFNKAQKEELGIIE